MALRLAILLLTLLCPLQTAAEIKRWRVGDAAHPWELAPVSGRLTWGRGWAVEIVTDDDGDGLIDEDPAELVDDDDDGLFNEDGPDPQLDNDGDGRLNEDPANKRDDDGDGLVDEDPVEAFDNDGDGLVDEDGPDPQFDNDGDGRLNEDGLHTDGDDDYDGFVDEDPYGGGDDDGDGLVDEDGPRPRDDGGATWLRPIELTPRRNLALLLNERYLQGEFGGLANDGTLLNPSLQVPSEFGARVEQADPISGDFFKVGSGGSINRVDYGLMVDGDLTTAYGGVSRGNAVAGVRNIHAGGPSMKLMGFYHINRLVFQPRPTLPNATINSYFIAYGDHTTIDRTSLTLDSKKILVPVTRGEAEPVVKDFRFDPPVLMGRVDVASLDSNTEYKETAEVGLYGVGFPTDASFTSEVIDVGTPTPRVRRYSQLLELFDDRAGVAAEFPDRPGDAVNWGKVRWRGRKQGFDGNVRIQFRAGDAPDMRIYARDSGADEIDTRDAQGRALDVFTWVKMRRGRIAEADLQYNELGPELGTDGPRGWSFWSAPFAFEDGLIDESLPAERQGEAGVALPLPSGTRYLQFRLLFDSTVASAVAIDYLEFDYDEPLVPGGVVAEIFPPRVALGEEATLRYFLRPTFAEGAAGEFNRIELTVPDPSTRVDAFKFDGQAWEELAVPRDADPRDPLAAVAPTAGDPLVDGQFAQAAVIDPATGETRLLVKTTPLDAGDFRARQTIEIGLRTRLFRGSAHFSGAVWDDRRAPREATIPQQVRDGDATQEVVTDAALVVVEDIAARDLEVRAAPNPFTPNGDGVNDAVEFAFDLFLFLDQVEVAVEILDLSGRTRHRVGPVRRTAGRTSLRWDGRDAAGALLPPGLYLYRLRVSADRRSAETQGVLSLVH